MGELFSGLKSLHKSGNRSATAESLKRLCTRGFITVDEHGERIFASRRYPFYREDGLSAFANM